MLRAYLIKMMNLKFSNNKIFFTLLSLFILFHYFSFAQAADDQNGKTFTHNSNLPTTITSESMQLDPQVNKFIYERDVKVVQGDMTLTCEKLIGFYDKQNQITKMEAYKNVVIIKGEKLEARGQKAVYDAKTQVATITENPEIIQGQSALVADLVKVYLDTERTEAEGRVQMKIIKENKDSLNK
jgi:lipopolysaccharide export system protein LptA